MLYDTAAKKAHFAPLDADGNYKPYQMRDIVDRVGGGDSFCGGLLTALKGMCKGGLGASIDITSIRDAYGELPVRILFSEVPGVLVQIRDQDFDYVDAELILQDIAYFPLGHTVRDADSQITVNYDSKSGVAGILQSLLSGQASEGED